MGVLAQGMGAGLGVPTARLPHPILHQDPCPSLPGHGGVQGHCVLVTPTQTVGGPGWNVPAWGRGCHRPGRAAHLPLSPSIPTLACGDNPDVPHTPGPCPPVPGASSTVTCVCQGGSQVSHRVLVGVAARVCWCGRCLGATGSVSRSSLGTSSPWGGQRGPLLGGTAVTPQRWKLLGCYFRQKV